MYEKCTHTTHLDAYHTHICISHISPAHIHTRAHTTHTCVSYAYTYHMHMIYIHVFPYTAYMSYMHINMHTTHICTLCTLYMHIHTTHTNACTSHGNTHHTETHIHAHHTETHKNDKIPPMRKSSQASICRPRKKAVHILEFMEKYLMATAQ